jgi:hypothetical protein
MMSVVNFHGSLKTIKVTPISAAQSEQSISIHRRFIDLPQVVAAFEDAAFVQSKN